MSYEKQTWQTGDVVTSAKLNHMEDGIAAAGGGVLVVNTTYDEITSTLTCDKTWAEINAAAPLVYTLNGKWLCPLSGIRQGGGGEDYSVFFYNLHSGTETSFSTESEDGYPSSSE